MSHLPDSPIQLQCSLFGTTYNPNNLRLGNKILRQRLKGPQLAAYYPRKTATVEDIQKEFEKYDLTTWNEEEEDRLEGLQIAKLRGKGAPKKKRTADGRCHGHDSGWYIVLIQHLHSEQEGQEEKEVALFRTFATLQRLSGISGVFVSYFYGVLAFVNDHNGSSILYTQADSQEIHVHSPTWPFHAPASTKFLPAIPYTPLPPSTSMLTPVMNLPSSLHKNRAALATSVGSVNLPSGTFPRKFFTFSGVCGTPTNVSNSPVPDKSGSKLLTRICLEPYSAAKPLVA